MGWGMAWDSHWRRDVGYGVPALCDHPKCKKLINRGLAYVCCSQEPYGGEKGCGLFFCYDHADIDHQCPRCAAGKPAYKRIKPEIREWLEWKLKHPSWERWRKVETDEFAWTKEAVKTAPLGGVEFSPDELREMETGIEEAA